MKKKFICIIIVIVVLIICLLIGQFIISYISKTQSSNISNTKNIFEMNSFITNDITKIKISKFDNSSEEPFTCYISDNKQIESFIDTFRNMKLEGYETNDNISPLYIIDFLGNNTTTVILSSNNIGQLSNSNFSKFFKLSNEDFAIIENLTDVKYYLHDSTLDKPSNDTYMNAQSIILSGLSDVEISNLRKQIHDVHSLLEFDLVDNVETLKNANNIYWEPATIDEVFTQPNGVKIQSDGFWQYRDSLQDLLDLNLNDSARSILNTIISRLQNGMDNHDLSECFEVHKLLHDFDYWIVNYPVGSFYAEPADWGGLDCYFGTIEEFHINQ